MEQGLIEMEPRSTAKRSVSRLEKLLNPVELAEVLRVRPGTVYSWISRKVDIPYVKIAGTVRFRERAIQDWLSEKEQKRKRRNFEA
jgi:excisionase family DNA binding protein